VPTDCFALLDDASGQLPDCLPSTRLYTELLACIECRTAGDLPHFLTQLEQALADGRHAVGMFTYELGAAMHGIFPHPQQSPVLATLLLFARCERLDEPAVQAWLAPSPAPAPCGVAALKPGMDEAAFCGAVETIHEYIKAGDTYQANLTFPLQMQAYGEPVALYARLRQRQPVPYGAFIRLPGNRHVLSLSPELFVSHKQGLLTAKPMKGTAAAGEAGENRQRMQALSASTKERAENLMIVDLLRNDFSRIAVTGTVRVPALFETERFGSVLQMTSTIHAQLDPEVSLLSIMQAIYPCGSITGAPKHHTMQLLRELEIAPRGLYTGAIGWFDAAASGKKIGDFTLSVPIRTLVLEAPSSDGLRAGVMGVGAGIVHDSRAGAEYAECLLKARFLSELPADFTLFETMQASRATGCRYEDLHLQRLAESADFFGFVFELASLQAALAACCAALPNAGSYRIKLSLQQSGAFVLESAPLLPLPQTVDLLLAKSATLANDIFLRHKTSVRQRYDAGWLAAEAQGAFDALFFNERGELTEGGRSTVFVKLNGRWITPPLRAGILPGVMRSVVLADPQWQAQEQTLYLPQLHQAQEIMVCNALRGILSAQIRWDSLPLVLD
jgi:para-aminobenzoate synthetase/4-amino-4-deoxychorismate lyase